MKPDALSTTLTVERLPRDSVDENSLIYLIQADGGCAFARFESREFPNLNNLEQRISLRLRKSVEQAFEEHASNPNSSSTIPTPNSIEQINSNILLGRFAGEYLRDPTLPTRAIESIVKLPGRFKRSFQGGLDRSPPPNPVQFEKSSSIIRLTYAQAASDIFEKLFENWEQQNRNVILSLARTLSAMRHANSKTQKTQDIRLTLFTPDSVAEAMSSSAQRQSTLSFPPHIIQQIFDRLIDEMETLSSEIRSSGGLVAVWVLGRLPIEKHLDFATQLSPQLADAIVHRSRGRNWLLDVEFEEIKKVSQALPITLPIADIKASLDNPNACLVLRIDDPEFNFRDFRGKLDFGTKQHLKKALSTESEKPLSVEFWLSTMDAIKAAGISFD